MRRVIIIEDDGQPGIGISPYVGLNDFYDPCANCNNNPKNNPNASGFCNCVLPDMYNHRYSTLPGEFSRQFEYYTTCSFNNINLNK